MWFCSGGVPVPWCTRIGQEGTKPSSKQKDQMGRSTRKDQTGTTGQKGRPSPEPQWKLDGGFCQDSFNSVNWLNAIRENFKVFTTMYVWKIQFTWFSASPSSSTETVLEPSSTRVDNQPSSADIMSSYSNGGSNVEQSTVPNVQPTSTAASVQPSEPPVTTQQPNTGSRLKKPNWSLFCNT